jgi:hypothetical protein
VNIQRNGKTALPLLSARMFDGFIDGSAFFAPRP